MLVPAFKTTLVHSHQYVLCVSCVTLLINFIFAAVAMIIFGANDPQNFGSLPLAIMSMWRIMTLDGWEEIMFVNSAFSTAPHPQL